MFASARMPRKRAALLKMCASGCLQVSCIADDVFGCSLLVCVAQCTHDVNEGVRLGALENLLDSDDKLASVSAHQSVYRLTGD